MNLKFTKRNLLFLVSILFQLSVFAQAENTKELVTETMQLRRDNNYFKGFSPFRAYIVDSAQILYQELVPYTSDSVKTVRSFAYNLIAITGEKSTNEDFRKSVVEILVKGANDLESSIRKSNSRQLESFYKSDFTQLAQDSLAALLTKKPTYYRNYIKLIGFLEIEGQDVQLNNLLSTETNKSSRWDLRIALARYGNQEAIDYCMDFVKNRPTSNQIINLLFPDLTYTRSRDAIDYMIEILHSNELNCSSPNPDNTSKIVCGYRVMQYLAPIIEDFPLPVDKYGDLDIDNYEEALQITRAWFLENADVYVILKDRF